MSCTEFCADPIGRSMLRPYEDTANSPNVNAVCYSACLMVHLQDVSFSYSSLKPPVLRGVNLKIEPLCWIAITGPDGSGKTTLGKLIK